MIKNMGSESDSKSESWWCYHDSATLGVLEGGSHILDSVSMEAHVLVSRQDAAGGQRIGHHHGKEIHRKSSTVGLR